MWIIKQNQYNQGINKYKLLSSNAGVGSIITTKMGYYILVSDINNWRFIRSSNERIRIIKETSNSSEWYNRSKIELETWTGIKTIDDKRFVEFLRAERALENLLCLVSIPQLSLNENFNSINEKENPTIQRIKKIDSSFGADHLNVPATHFPKWFMNERGNLRPYKDWRARWLKKNYQLFYFVPPRDCDLPENPKKIKIKVKDHDVLKEVDFPIHSELVQLNLILICPNGHLSDIPWSQFLRWRTRKEKKEIPSKDEGNSLFDEEPCCAKPELKWSENKNKSEGYGSVYIECLNCKMGSGGKENPKINLEGINNLHPNCKSQKPWEIDLNDNNDIIPQGHKCTKLNSNESQPMDVSLVTGNRVYFANGFSSLYIPIDLAEGIDATLVEALEICNKQYDRYNRPDKQKAVWAEQKLNEEFIYDNGFDIEASGIKVFLENVRSLFLDDEKEEISDSYEHYRWQEYQCFKNNTTIDRGNLLSFKDSVIPEQFKGFFNKIQQIDQLQVSNVQLDFTRVSPNERIRSDEGDIIQREGQNIFSIDKNALHILPASTSLGEGIFFDFDSGKINEWISQNKAIIDKRLSKITNNKDINKPGAALRQKITENSAKYLLIHTFSHLIMRELEFSCGYPTASLKERLYISNRMSGVLIYTSEGSEGSMGGLVWQAQSDKIDQLIIDCLNRAKDCSSDPLCWESDGQGIYDLNLAACFSCSLTSEISCEERNLALDRRFLIDPEFGFFKSHVY